MRSVKVIVAHKLCKPLGHGIPTANPRVMEAVGSHFKSVKPLFDEVSVDVVQMTAQIDSKDCSQKVIAIDEKFGVREIKFLGELLEKLCRWLDPYSFEKIDAKQYL